MSFYIIEIPGKSRCGQTETGGRLACVVVYSLCVVYVYFIVAGYPVSGNTYNKDPAIVPLFLLPLFCSSLFEISLKREFSTLSLIALHRATPH